MNKLEKETSPYLLEHKNNPVNWYAWNNEALEKAILEEEYEVAARLRDRIKQLEKKSTS